MTWAGVVGLLCKGLWFIPLLTPVVSLLHSPMDILSSFLLRFGAPMPAFMRVGKLLGDIAMCLLWYRSQKVEPNK